MTRDILELSLDEVRDRLITAPVRYVFKRPLLGGPKLSELRALLHLKGVLRFSSSDTQLFADLDPGEPEVPVLALDMIARSDAVGLERMILSVLPEVDEIVIGVDGRSDQATHEVARAYADTYHVFQAQDVGLSAGEWAADCMHFANARNIGRAKVKAPWVIFVDSDEFLRPGPRLLRDVLREATIEGSFGVEYRIGLSRHLDTQRIARTEYRWRSPAHNQLVIDGPVGSTICGIDATETLRTPEEIARRDRQRAIGVDMLREEAAKGQMIALYHVAKHDLGGGDFDRAVAEIQDFRARADPHGQFAGERAWLAFGVAAYLYMKDDCAQAEVWAVRALLDGPYVPAFCILGDIAEEQGDLVRARDWYEAACAAPDVANVQVEAADSRFERLKELRCKLADADVQTVSGD